MEMEHLTQDHDGVGGDHMQLGKAQPVSQHLAGAAVQGHGVELAALLPLPLPGGRQPRGDGVTATWQGASISADLSTQKEEDYNEVVLFP